MPDEKQKNVRDKPGRYGYTVGATRRVAPTRFNAPVVRHPCLTKKEQARCLFHHLIKKKSNN